MARNLHHRDHRDLKVGKYFFLTCSCKWLHFLIRNSTVSGYISYEGKVLHNDCGRSRITDFMRPWTFNTSERLARGFYQALVRNQFVILSLR